MTISCGVNGSEELMVGLLRRPPLLSIEMALPLLRMLMKRVRRVKDFKIVL